MGSFFAPETETDMIFGDGVGAFLVSLLNSNPRELTSHGTSATSMFHPSVGPGESSQSELQTRGNPNTELYHRRNIVDSEPWIPT